MSQRSPTPEFKVVIRGYSTSVEDWQRAMEAPDGEAPDLSDEQKVFAKKFGVSEKEYARGVLAGEYGEERLRQRTLALGQRVQQVLARSGTPFKLETIVAEMTELRWVLLLEGPDEVKVQLPIPRALGDDVVDSAVPETQRDFEGRILSAVGAKQSLGRG